MKKNFGKLLALFAFICFFSFSGYAQTITPAQIASFETEIAAAGFDADQTKLAMLMLNTGRAERLRNFLDNNGTVVFPPAKTSVRELYEAPQRIAVPSRKSSGKATKVD